MYDPFPLFHDHRYGNLSEHHADCCLSVCRVQAITKNTSCLASPCQMNTWRIFFLIFDFTTSEVHRWWRFYSISRFKKWSDISAASHSECRIRTNATHGKNVITRTHRIIRIANCKLLPYSCCLQAFKGTCFWQIFWLLSLYQNELILLKFINVMPQMYLCLSEICLRLFRNVDSRCQEELETTESCRKYYANH